MKQKYFLAFLLIPAFFALLSQPVHAYIDPATTSYLIQIISALVITLGVTLGLFFNRIRIFFMNIRVKLARFWVRLGQPKEGQKGAFRPAARGRIDKGHLLWSDTRSYPRRLGLSALVAGVLALTLWLFGTLEVFAGNPQEFAFPFTALLPGLLLLALAVSLLSSLLLALVPGRVFDGLLSLLLGLLLAAYAQAAFMNGSLGQLTGDAVAWEGMGREMLVNSLLWLVILCLPLLVRLIHKKTWNYLVRWLPALLLVIQLISGLVLLVREPALVKSASQSYLSTEGIYQLASEDNILVIILDRLDNRYVEAALAESPDFLDPLDGFTRFTNNSSLYSQTFPSVTEMLTGYGFLFDEDSNDYMKRAWTQSDFLPGLIQEGYTSRLYLPSNQAYRKAEDLQSLAQNLSQGKISVDKEAVEAFSRLTFYRHGPLSMKPFFWTSSDRFDKLVTSQDSPPPYQIDDIGFYQGLKASGLSLSEDKKAFTFLHLQGPHAPYNMNEFGEEVEAGQSSSLIQTKGSFHILYDYLDQMKALGLYQDATIIVTGDHGARSSDTRLPDAAMATALFVKPAGQAGSPLAYQDAPVSSDNFQATIYQAAGLDASAYGPSYFEVSPYDFVVRLVYHRLYASDNAPSRLLTYQIVGDANDFDDWILVDEKEIK